jgi:twitching motility protein PilT
VACAGDEQKLAERLGLFLPLAATNAMAEHPALADLLRLLVEHHGSDLHVQAGEVPMGRIHGQLGRFEMPPLSQDAVLRLAREVLGSDEKHKEFVATRDCDAAVAIPELGRFRANLFYQRDKPGMVLRTIGTKILSVDALELPEVLKSIAAANDGLVLVTGATGSGKSTTLAALIDHINATEACHIMTLEDPIEFVHENKLALVNQREMAVDSASFASALKHVLRQDPDVILIGEMRDMESATVALTAAETGHLVFATLHTSSASQCPERIVDVFPAGQQEQARLQLSESLQGILSQILVERTDGGLAPAQEILVANDAVRALIRERKTPQLYNVIQTGGREGMRTLESSLNEYVAAGIVTYETAVRNANLPEQILRR